MDDPRSYRPISLLCVPYKLLERLLFRLEPPTQQGGFRRGRFTVQQVVKLTSVIEESYEEIREAGLVLVDLTAAYDTVWHQGLTLKLLQTIPDRHPVRFIVEIISDRSFILKTSDGQCSRLRRLKNGVPQGPTLAPMLFNIYIRDIPDTVSTQYCYADDLALLFSHKCWNEVEKVLSLDMQRVADYLSAWRLRLSTAKTTCTAFHLNNRESSRKLAVTVNGTTIPYTQNPTYLGVMPDRQLTFRQHLEGLCGKVRARNCLPRLLAGSTWGVHASVLRTSALALAYSAAEYAAPAWCRSTHTKKLDAALNDTMHIISGGLKPTRREFLPVLTGIPPAHLRREHSTFKLALQAQLNANHPFMPFSTAYSCAAHSACIHDVPSTAMLRRC